MLILKKPKLIISNPCNADIRELSCYPQEEKVLVFPVCALGIDDIKKVGNIYYIELKYLEDYVAIKEKKLNNNINNNKNINNYKNINNNIPKEAPKNTFKEVVKKTGLVKEKEINNDKIIDYYSKYDSQNKKSCCSKKCKIISGIIIFLLV